MPRTVFVANTPRVDIIRLATGGISWTFGRCGNRRAVASPSFFREFDSLAFSRSSRLALRTSSPKEARSEALAMTFVAPEESGILNREKDDAAPRAESWGVPPAIALDAFSAAVLRRSPPPRAAEAEADDNDVDSSIAAVRAVRAVRAAPRARAADSDDASVSSLASGPMMDCMERWV